jgi:hypothetical protein
MGHPTEGVLRRLLDEPAGVADRDRRHAASCGRCRGGVAAMREDATLIHAALAAPDGADLDLDAGWQRLSAAARAAPAAGPERRPPALRAGRVRARGLLRRPAVAALAAGALLTGAGAAAASGWLEIFRTEQVAPVRLGAADLVALPDLTAYGDVEVTSEADVREVPDAASATAQTGLEVPEVDDLPRGISGTPAVQAGSRVSASFTFSAARAARAAARAGRTLPPPPRGVDGSRVRLVAGPGVAQVWRSSAGVPALVVGRAVAPSAYSSGVPFETVRDYLLSLPGLPEDVAAVLRTFTADRSTLPLPVPADEITTSPARVGGEPATLLVTRDRTLAAVVWVQDGLVTAVAGALDAEEVLSIAEDL